MNNRQAMRRGALTVGVLGWAIVTTGCHPQARPFVDPYANRAPVTTASSTGAFEEKMAQRHAQRTFATARVAAADGSVTHGPLYFEDGFGDAATDDGHFAWTGDDFLHMFTWRVRFLANLVFFPISLVDTPPGLIMTSDGTASRQVLGIKHDARPVDSTCCPNRSPEPSVAG